MIPVRIGIIEKHPHSKPHPRIHPPSARQMAG
jgi:hypothetical protein